MAVVPLFGRRLQTPDKKPEAVNMIGHIVIAAIVSLLTALVLYRDRSSGGAEFVHDLCHCGNSFGPQPVKIERGLRCKLCGRRICPTPGQAHEFLLRCTLISFYAVATMILVALPSIVIIEVLKTYWMIPVFIVLGIITFRLICGDTPVGRWHDFVNVRLDAIDNTRAKESWSRYRNRHARELSDLSPADAYKLEDAVGASSVFHSDPVNQVLSGIGTILAGGVVIYGVLFFVMDLWKIVPNEQVLVRYALRWYGAWSILTFATMYYDKSMARGGSNKRIAERQLHFYEMMGGFPGSLAAQWILRHKVRKFSYQVVFYLIAILHLSAWSWLLIQQW